MKRPKLQATLSTASRRGFDVLVLRDVVQLADAGVRGWSYSERAFVQLDGFG